jgi:hypothetical protein
MKKWRWLLGLSLMTAVSAAFRGNHAAGRTSLRCNR